MDKMIERIGSIVNVHLNSECVITGKLTSIEQEYVSVDGDLEYIIPVKNIAFFSLDKESNSCDKKQNHDNTKYVPAQKSENMICVLINGEHLINIPFPPSMSVDEWSNELHSMIISNDDVRSVLSGRIQKSISYRDRIVDISVKDIVEPPQPSNSTFSTSLDGSPTSKFVSPINMVSRLNKVVGDENDQT